MDTINDGICFSIRCDNEATMAIRLRTRFPGTDDDDYEHAPQYCDDCLGWFYRSFARKSYNTEVLGVDILKDMDEDFGRI